MQTIQNMPQLTDLHIYSVPVTAQGVNTLSNLNNLKNLGLISTNVSDANLARLKQALPNTKFTVTN